MSNFDFQRGSPQVVDPPKRHSLAVPTGPEAMPEGAERGSCAEASGRQLLVLSGDCRGKTGTCGASVAGETFPGLALGTGTPSAPSSMSRYRRGIGEGVPFEGQLVLTTAWGRGGLRANTPPPPVFLPGSQRLIGSAE